MTKQISEEQLNKLYQLGNPVECLSVEIDKFLSIVLCLPAENEFQYMEYPIRFYKIFEVIVVCFLNTDMDCLIIEDKEKFQEWFEEI